MATHRYKRATAPDGLLRHMMLLLVTLLMIGCNATHKEEVRRDHTGAMSERVTILRKTGAKDGPYQRWAQGILLEQAHYMNDTLHGIRVSYLSDGQKDFEETFDRGIHHGPYRNYYPAGQLKIEGTYIDGAMEGTWTKYYESGQLMEKVQMRNNVEDGPFVEYWENGNMKAEGHYFDGDNEHGELKLYHEDGSLSKVMQCDRGLCHTVSRHD